MSAQRAFELTNARPQQSASARHRCYTTLQILEVLHMPRRTFSHLKRTGQLPFVQELCPRVGRCARYRADLIDRYLAGQWGEARAFQRARVR